MKRHSSPLWLAAAAALALFGTCWLALSDRPEERPFDLGSMSPTGRGSQGGGVETPSLDEADAPRVGVTQARWTVTFDPAIAEVEAVEPPIYVVIEAESWSLESTIDQRDATGRFELELDLSADEIRSSTIYIALDRTAAEARVGTVLRLDQLRGRTRLARCLPASGEWDERERRVDLGRVSLCEPMSLGVLSLAGAEFADLEVEVGCYRRAHIDDRRSGFLDDGIRVVRTAGTALSRRRFALFGTEDSVEFGTFIEAQGWSVSAWSPDLERFRSRTAKGAFDEVMPHWRAQALVGSEICLPVSQGTDIDLWLDLSKLPDARQVLVRPVDVPAAYTLSSEQLQQRLAKVAVAGAGLYESMVASSGEVPLGLVQLYTADRCVAEVWSGPDDRDEVRMIHIESLPERRGYKKLVLP